MKPLIVYSSQNIASKNIAQFIDGSVDMVDVNARIVEFDPPKGPWDYYIVLSTHRAASGIPSVTVHVPGNWGKAELGGKDNALCPSFPSMMLNILKRYNIPGYERTYEADHHGPYFEKPVMFVELGSTEKEWRDEKAAKLVAKAVLEAIDDPNRYPTYFGVGGTHYVSKLTKYSLEKEVAYTHLLAKYQDGFKEEKLLEGLKLSLEPAEAILMDKKGLSGEQRRIVKEFANKYGIEIIQI
ncbi:MAG: D-tyrosyl-tRNA(Tyr) deacylase [Candidatus Micrarchaeota archaeon]|nr:D-tyrosyl-tRNA(Tyr) deacylase [Candidatus Micrarchaeota archaeon]